MTGEALILATRPFGERDAVVELLCPERGRLRGLVKGGRATRGNMPAVLQPFNSVTYEHFRRLESQLGSLTVELTRSRAHVWMGLGAGRFVVPYVSELLTQVLPEEHPYPHLAARTVKLLESPIDWRQLIAYELTLLEAVGYGLRLRPEEAVDCPHNSPLAYVSPASGRAVPLGVAKGYESRLLPLPHSLGGPECAEADDFAHAWRLTGYFIAKSTNEKPLETRTRLGNHYTAALAQNPVPHAA